MTPEEFGRAMEFIIQHLAHFNASLDREQEMRAARFAEHEARLAEHEERLAEHGKSRKRMEALQTRVAKLIGIQSELLVVQSRRLDAYQEWQKEFQRESPRKKDDVH